MAATFRLLRRVKVWMDAEVLTLLRQRRLEMAGALAGRQAFHGHLHVMPRFRQEPLAGHGLYRIVKSEANRW